MRYTPKRRAVRAVVLLTVSTPALQQPLPPGKGWLVISMKNGSACAFAPED